jgi:UDP-2-acetamido-2,6-beta-L-arabino-hexul-4-ose reductase
MKITITGQAGFVGTHLYNWLKLDDKFELIDFKDEYFQDQSKL